MSVSSLASLLKQSHIEDDEEVLRAANAALKQSKSDLEAHHVKVVALLKLDRFDDALHALNAGGDALKSRATIEHAYVLYKTGQPAAAAEVAHRNTKRASKHIEAQASYRNEDFLRAAELYRELASNLEDDAVADLRVNLGAAEAQLEWSGRGDAVQKKKPSRDDLEAFETAYNAACASIARGELAQGEILLKRSRTLCESLEDLSEEEKSAELLPITIQQIYVLTRLGRNKEAEALAQGLDVSSLSGSSTQYIARVNEFAAQQTSANPFLVQRLLDQGLASAGSDQPFKFQAETLKQNKFASDIQSLKYEGTAESTRVALSKVTLPSTDALYTSMGVVNAAAHARNQTGKEALKHVLPVLERRPHDVGLLLTTVQLYVLTNNLAAATALLEKFLAQLEQSAEHHDARFAPGVVGTLVSLYRKQGRKAPLRSELAKAASYWRRKSKAQPPGLTHLYKAAGSALLESNEAEHQELAREIFMRLREQDSSDRYAAAGLLAASPEQASPDHLSTLTPTDRLLSHVDAEALENAGVATIASSSTTSATTTKKRPADENKTSQPKKLRKSRIPKDYDPSKTPDPERWLPLRDRSTYRPKGKKGKARQALLSQGAVSTAVESDGSRPATPRPDVVKGKAPGGGGGGGGGGQKKKKGKGGKW
jgi:signal recognition particle subunit SRP72